MNFNPDPSKQAQVVIFSRKIKQTNHPPLFFNHNLVNATCTQKQEIVLDAKLDFKVHQQKACTIW